jgi:hypothetical protein
MSVILFILGILVTGAGIVAIGFGIPINEFNLGYTLIVSGTTAFAGGLILIGLAAAVDQLNQIVLGLRPRAGARPGPQPQAAEPALPGAARPTPQPPGQVPVKAAMPAPPRNPVPAKAKAEERGPLPTLAEAVAEASPSAIERLRLSMGRVVRKTGDEADTGEVPYASPASAPPPGPGVGAEMDPRMDPRMGPDIGDDIGPTNMTPNGAVPTGGPGAAPARKPPLDFLFRSKAREPQPEAFDAVWPKRAAPRRPDEQVNADEPMRPAIDEVPITSRPYPDTLPSSSTNELRPAAILKSGVVDGMAYTLYADGSIEAQLPQGTVRFGSIAELRSHIENST